MKRHRRATPISRRDECARRGSVLPRMTRLLTTLALLASVAHASEPVFTIDAPDAAERLRLARVRCGGEAGEVSDGGFTCTAHPGADVLDALAGAERVIRGVVTQVDAKTGLAEDEAQWRRALVSVKQTLKGPAVKSVRVFFIGSTSSAYDYAPKLTVGQEAVFLLTRGTGAMRELTVLSDFDVQPVSAVSDLKTMLAGAACPAKPSGACTTEGAVCPGAETTCTCEAACGGGHAPPPGTVRTTSWVCRPTACASAKVGAACAPDGLACAGCWGTTPWTCVKGTWRYRRIAPPPAHR